MAANCFEETYFKKTSNGDIYFDNFINNVKRRNWLKIDKTYQQDKIKNDKATLFSQGTWECFDGVIFVKVGNNFFKLKNKTWVKSTKEEYLHFENITLKYPLPVFAKESCLKSIKNLGRLKFTNTSDGTFSEEAVFQNFEKNGITFKKDGTFYTVELKNGKWEKKSGLDGTWKCYLDDVTLTYNIDNKKYLYKKEVDKYIELTEPEPPVEPQQPNATTEYPEGKKCLKDYEDGKTVVVNDDTVVFTETNGDKTIFYNDKTFDYNFSTGAKSGKWGCTLGFLWLKTSKGEYWTKPTKWMKKQPPKKPSPKKPDQTSTTTQLPIPPMLANTDGVKLFQDWLDKNYPNWHPDYPGTGLKSLPERGYGIYGKNTNAAWDSEKGEKYRNLFASGQLYGRQQTTTSPGTSTTIPPKPTIVPQKIDTETIPKEEPKQKYIYLSIDDL